jgi:hypothetical protein
MRKTPVDFQRVDDIRRNSSRRLDLHRARSDAGCQILESASRDLAARVEGDTSEEVCLVLNGRTRVLMILPSTFFDGSLVIGLDCHVRFEKETGM